MKKICITIFLFALIISISPQNAASAESINIQKIVSVVYDDSVSIHLGGSKNWAYANYAMQSFCGLLNEEDKLFITYCSSPNKSVQLDLSKRQDAIDSIRTHSQAYKTPYVAIDNAFNNLVNVSDSNKNTQYWLVIITDGVFVKTEKNAKNSEVLTTNEDLTEKLDGFTSKVMPNGSRVRITYLAIGEDALSPKVNLGRDIFVYPEPGEGAIVDQEKIVGVMSKIADKVSGRTNVSPEYITAVDAKTVKIKSSIPLLNIAVLVQKTNAKLVSAKTSGGENIEIKQSVSMTYPEVIGRTTDKGLKGTTSLAYNPGGNIEAGTYVLTFSNAIEIDALDIMLEPALEVRMEISFRSGKVINNVNALHVDDVINIKCKIFETGTNKEINIKRLTTSTSNDVSYYEEGIKIDRSTDSSYSLIEMKLKDVDTRITASLVIEGFVPMANTTYFMPKKPLVYTMKALKNTDNIIVRNKIHINKKSAQFEVFAYGLKLTKDELDNTDIQFSFKDKYKKRLFVDTAVLDNGTVVCTPRYDGIKLLTTRFMNWTLTWICPSGNAIISAGVAGKELATSNFKIVRENLFLTVFNCIFPVMILFYLYGFIFKPRFGLNSYINYIPAMNIRGLITSATEEWKTKKLRGINLWTFVPWFKNRITISGVTFYALGNDAIGVKPQKVGVESMHLDGKTINEYNVANFPTIHMKRSFVSKNEYEIKKQPLERFLYDEVLLETADMKTCKFFKLSVGEKIKKTSKKDDD